jgi:hypothetical protein
MQNSKWSAKDTQKLSEMVSLLKSDLHIATALGRTEKAISIKRSKMGLVAYHLEKPKGKKIGMRAKPTPGRLPGGAQLILEDFIPKMSGKDAFKLNEAFYKSAEKRKNKALEGVEEIYPGPCIQKTIHSDVGILGTINIYNHDGISDFTITNLSPRNAINILAAIISKLVIE